MSYVRGINILQKVFLSLYGKRSHPISLDRTIHCKEGNTEHILHVSLQPSAPKLKI